MLCGSAEGYQNEKVSRWKKGKRSEYQKNLYNPIFTNPDFLISSIFILHLSIAVGGDSETSSSASSVIVRQVNARGHQVWSQTQFSSVSFFYNQGSVSLKILHPYNQVLHPFQWCPWTYVPKSAPLMVFSFLCTYASNARGEGLKRRQGICWGERKRKIFNDLFIYKKQTENH